MAFTTSDLCHGKDVLSRQVVLLLSYFLEKSAHCHESKYSGRVTLTMSPWVRRSHNFSDGDESEDARGNSRQDFEIEIHDKRLHAVDVDLVDRNFGSNDSISTTTMKKLARYPFQLYCEF